jgi:hypothetical protein
MKMVVASRQSSSSLARSSRVRPSKARIAISTEEGPQVKSVVWR